MPGSSKRSESTSMATRSEIAKKFLGRGWTFPIQVDGRGGISLSSEEELVKQSILQILFTSFGERVMLRLFGSGLQDLVFEPADELIEREVDAEVRDPLARWERRIDILDVSTIPDPQQPELINIILSYRLIRENRIGNLIIPFALTAGTVPIFD